LLCYCALRFSTRDPGKAMKNVLIVENETQIAPALQPVLEAAGLAVVPADRREAVVTHLEQSNVHVVLVNLEGLKQEGLAIVRAVRALAPEIAVITLNTADQMDVSIQAMRMGVFDELLMPVNVENLIASIRRAVGHTGGPATKPAATPAPTPRLEGEIK